MAERTGKPAAKAWKEVPWAFGRHRPLVCPPVIGTGNGGLRALPGELVAGLIDTLDDLVGADGQRPVDVVLCCWQKCHYVAAQAYRRKAGNYERRFAGMACPDIDDHWVTLLETADELAARAAAGTLCLFLGAGVSSGCGLPTWADLLNQLGAVSGLLDAIDKRTFDNLHYLDKPALIARHLEDRGLSLGGEVASIMEGSMDRARGRMCRWLRVTVHAIDHKSISTPPHTRHRPVDDQWTATL